MIPPLIFRIDTRVGPDTFFWARVRKAFLPSFSGQVFWVTSRDFIGWCHPPPPHFGSRLTLDIEIMRQYVPRYCRMSNEERIHMFERYHRHRLSPQAFAIPADCVRHLNLTGLIKSGRITTLGWNSYFLSS